MNKTITKFFTAACTVVLAGAFSLSGAAGFAADAAHTHTFSSEWSKGEVNHWHASTCGDDIVKDVAPHTFGSDGVCTECGYEQPAAVHIHNYETKWTADTVNHWHASACEHDIVRDMAAHDFENGRCTVCGYVKPVEVHEHTFAETWSSDAKNHWHASTCGDNIVADMSAHTLKNGVCTVCGHGELIIPEIEVTASGAYDEGIYVEWKSSADEEYFVYYRQSGAEQWLPVDGQLIRTVSTQTRTERVDIVGLAAGEYEVNVCTYESGNEIAKQYIIEDIEVSAYDRSGYAHFNYTAGVGAYNDDGTPKADATVIYVNESNKNTVTAKFGSTTYTGIANILANASKCATPLIVRVIGRVSAATWKPITYTKTSSNTDGKNNLLASAIVGANGKQLPTDSASLKQDALIKGGYNELQTDITELNGLNSYATYKDGAYDSCWNDCSISGAENVTVEGIGTDAEIFQWGLTWSNCNSIEVRNITFTDYTEDACSFQGGTNQTAVADFDYNNFWVHHNVFNRGKNYWDVSDEQDKHDGDGSVDLKRLANITIAYNYFVNTHKTNLIGADDASCTANITIHHNYFNSCESRLPLARVANMHMYNNYYKGKGNSGTGLSIRSGAYAFVEYCYFENQHTPLAAVEGTKIIDGQTEELWGFIKLYNCKFVNSSYSASDYIKDAENRSDRFANDNIYNQYFDTDAEAFYYDAANKKSDVTELITDLNKIPELVVQLAGVHKLNG